MDGLGVVHTALAIVALGIGWTVLSRRKGDRMHRTLGHLYVSCMCGVNLTSFGLRGLSGTWGPFHVAAVISLLTLLAGLVPVVTRRPRGRWFEMHAYFMAWSYIGLVAAAASETAVRLPGAPFWPGVAAGTALVMATGAWLLHGGGGERVRRALRRAGVVTCALLLVALSKTDAQEAPLAAMADSLRQEVERAVIRADHEALRAARASAEHAAASHAESGLLHHYLGYALYREALLMAGEEQDRLLLRAERALEKAMRLHELPESFALAAVVEGHRIGHAWWRGILGSRRAARLFERAEELGPANPRVALLRAVYVFHAPSFAGGGAERARREVQRALELFSGDAASPPLPAWGHAEAHAWHGRILRGAGDQAGARAAYERALALQPDYVWVKDVLLPALKW